MLAKLTQKQKNQLHNYILELRAMVWGMIGMSTLLWLGFFDSSSIVAQILLVMSMVWMSCFVGINWEEWKKEGERNRKNGEWEC